MAPRFVIVGTGRSGSKYIAEVLTAAGILCGHESWWNTWGTRDDTVLGDSSCCALPIGLYGYQGTIFHQTRHPLDVITSLVQAPIAEPHLGLFHRLAGGDPADPLGFAMSIWRGFSRAADVYGPVRWRLDQVDAILIRWIAAWVGCPVTEEAAQAALCSVSCTCNQHYTDRTTRLSWDDLHNHNPQLTDQIREQATAYGFQ